MKKHEQVNKLDPSHPFSQLHLLASAEWHLRLPSKLLMDGNRTGHLADATLRGGTVAEHGQNVADPFTTRSWDGRIIVQELILPKPEVQWQYYLWMTYPSIHSSKFLSNDVCIYIYRYICKCTHCTYIWKTWSFCKKYLVVRSRFNYSTITILYHPWSTDSSSTFMCFFARSC